MNLLLIIFDDLTTTLGCYGHPLAKTPHIDRLAARGTRFTQSFTSCGLCNPSRASLFTGLRPDTTGVRTLKEPLRHKLPYLTTWPQALRMQQYRTMRAGKVFHKGVPDGVATRSPGKDDPYAWEQRIEPPGYELNCNGEYHNATPWRDHQAGTGGAIAWLKAEKGDNHHHDHHVTSEVIERMNRWQGESWMLAAGYVRPHVPLVAPRRFFDLYDPADIPLPEIPDGASPLLPIMQKKFGYGFNITEDDHRAAIAAYLACVSFVDEQVGRLLDALDQTGQADDTLIVLTADHGFHLGDHGLWFKNFLFRGSTQVPLIIADPHRPASHGRECDALVDNTDVFPTVFELLDKPMPHSGEGTSLLPLIDRQTDAVHDAIFHQCHNPGVNIHGRAVRTTEWLYCEWNGGADGRELYDLRHDPGEYFNLIDAHPDTARQLAAHLTRD